MPAFLTIFTRMTFGVAYVLVLFAGGMAIVPKLSNLNGFRHQRADWIQRIGQEKKQVKKLKGYQQRFKSDHEFVEIRARSNKRAYADELVFIFEPDPED